jgi:hypothetical protein
MSYEGEVRGGTIVLDPSVALPEGTRVQVVVLRTGHEWGRRPFHPLRSIARTRWGS